MTRHWQVELAQARRRVRVLEYLLERSRRPKPEIIGGGKTVEGKINWLLENFGMQDTNEIAERLKPHGIGRDTVQAALKVLAVNCVAFKNESGRYAGKWSLIAYTLILLCFTGCQSPTYQTPTAAIEPPKPEVGWPLESTQPALPMLESARENQTAKSITTQQVQAPKFYGNLIVRWDLPLVLPANGYEIFGNGVLLATVSNSYDNCTLSGLPEGQPIVVYAASGEDRSNVATGFPFRTPWTRLIVEPYAFRYDWQTQPGTTNLLQGSRDLVIWTNLATLRATTATATVTVTNPPNFSRVLIRNATNFNAPTLAMSQALVRLSWQGDGTLKTLERKADKKTGSYVDVLTSNQSGLVSIVIKPDDYRVTP